ncbi:MAG: hypothetical protein KJ077_11275 [Anaerolineae bacterium]|nr:hypothetical protein [Anaerolineae bacterium]
MEFAIKIPTLNLEKPTDPANYIDREFARGTPLNWQDDVTGRLRAAVMDYLNQKPTDEQLKLVIAFVQHHIHAPCWLEASPFGEVDEEMAAEIKALRELSLTLVSLKDVNQFINRAIGIGLDPL